MDNCRVHSLCSKCLQCSVGLVSVRYECVTSNNVRTVMTSKFSFSSPEVEKLALLVQANPVLFKPLHANYKNISLRDSIWKEISLEIEESGKHVIN